MQRKNNNKKNGYTIIETMIAVSLFIVIVTMGMNSLLSANVVHQKSQNTRSLLDSLSFVMEDMSRNIRTGYDYHCILFGEGIPSDIPAPKSCLNGGGISFKSGVDGGQWAYLITTNPRDGSYNSIFKTANGENNIQMTPDEIKIDPTSSFVIAGAEPPPADYKQPFVTIKLVGKITYKGVDMPFSLQTSVSQRRIDIGS